MRVEAKCCIYFNEKIQIQIKFRASNIKKVCKTKTQRKTQQNRAPKWEPCNWF